MMFLGMPVQKTTAQRLTPLVDLPAHNFLRGRVFLRRMLNEPSSSAIRYLGGVRVVLSEKKTTSTVEIIRTGNFDHAEYGAFAVTADHLDSFVRNFNGNAYGQKIFIDVGHKPQDGAAGEIKQLYVDGNTLKALVEWTPYGLQAIRERGCIYLSADYYENWTDNETKQSYGPLLLGAGLVTRPHIKRMKPIQLAEYPNTPALIISPDLTRTLSQEAKRTMNVFLKLLQEAYGQHKLSEKVQAPLLEAFKAAATALGEDEAALKMLTEQYKAIGDGIAKQLGESSTAPVNVVVGMTDAQVKQLIESDRKTLAEQQAASDKKLSDNRTAYTKAITDAQGLSDDTRKILGEGVKLITGDMSDTQVTALVEFQLEQGNRLEAQRKLHDIGFVVAGSPRISVDESNNIKSLHESVRKALQLTNAHASNTLMLSEKPLNARFVEMVLAEYDRRFAHQLHKEQRMLSGAETHMGSAFLPSSFQREVIREALADLNILQLVRTQVDPGATTTTEIPYEERTSSASIPNEGIVYEGKGIPFAGVGLKHDVAYVAAMKLALKVTNEIMHFSQSSGVNWNAWGENIASNARIMRELIHLRVANEMLRASDTHLAQAVTGESFTASASGLIKTVKYPVVRPLQIRDLKGNTIGNAECPVTITIGGADVPYFTGEPNLPAGTYWRFNNLNLGYIQLVDQTGASAGAGATGTLGYSTTGNVVKFDLALPANTKYRDHLNELLSMVGDQKAMLTSQRFVRPEYALMSSMLNNEASKASQFVVSLKRDGTTNTLQGDLEAVKNLPAFDCNAPGMDVGDQRILIGQRGLTGYSVIKPYSVGMPFEAVDETGHPTGEKVAYGEEYNALHTPKPVRNRYTSVLVFDSATR
ncbi:MAG: hypothetical protein BWK73_04565 [Thiothrix lacustris]|uniref:Uncharacterized protein n=1 Tax=Thiothrix lacustris TaxID=525917 RepID=A0A1Y1QXN2_9GAMM|nr:MAG: hypothetical protein BWK73_04565 [Thiothrix lacustris]